MEKRFLDYDPFLGITEYHYYDPDTDTCMIEQVQDASPIVQNNLIQRNLTDRNTRWDGGEEGMVKVASIPMNIWADLNAKGIVRDKAAFKKWLNDPDNRFFRTREGVV